MGAPAQRRDVTRATCDTGRANSGLPHVNASRHFFEHDFENRVDSADLAEASPATLISATMLEFPRLPGYRARYQDQLLVFLSTLC